MRYRALAAVVAAILLVSGCVSLPRSGEVTTEPGAGPVDDFSGSFDYTPSGPRAGSSPVQIVEDFLLAMQASPQSTAVARKYLTDEGRAGWFPEKTTLVYGAKLVTGDGHRLKVSLDQTVQLDDRGTWLGTVGGRDGVTYELEVVRERGQWRISNPPDALIIPRTHFDSRYQQYFVYFFDPSGQVLVPQPTYLPRGDQAATLLVRRLLLGPDPRLDGVLRTYIPGGTEYVLSVPVSQDGTAEVSLNDQLLRSDAGERELALAQLAWSLRQVAGVESMRVTVDGAPLDIPGAGSPQSVDSWTEFDPAVHWASQEVFGLRDGNAYAFDADTGELAGEFGAREYVLRDAAVDLTGEVLAGVTEDGTTAVVAPRGVSVGDPPSEEQSEVVHVGTDLLRPAWDVFDELWLVDRAPTGAVLRVVVDGEATVLDAPGLSGHDVIAFTVSRDGSRLVAAVPGRSGDRLVMSRVLRSPAGKVRGLTRTVDVPLAPGGVDEIRDVAWRSPGSVAVLTGPTPESSQVLLALVDGSTAVSDIDTTAEILRRRAARLATSPSADAPVLLGTETGEVFELGVDGRWAESVLRHPLQAVTFAG